MQDYAPPRCELLPLPEHQVAFLVDGEERTRWHYGAEYPRPFLYPLNGPTSGTSLTRMGHPGAENHDHHRSVWFAHHKLLGINFWGDNTEARIRQQHWLVYEDGDDQAAMAVRLGWFDGHDPQPLVEQDAIVAVRPLADGEYALDVQCEFRSRAESIEFQQSNFGFLAVRVAKSISGHFGGGTITSSEGLVGEKEIFGKPARWMDYSGPVRVAGEPGRTVVEGITFFDHPGNPRHPAKWHVREDGWMGASACRDEGLLATRETPLRLRYLLHVHSGGADATRANRLFDDWQNWPAWTVVKSTRPHRQYDLKQLEQNG
ncbi:PmoA family protein [Maioricimonas sp. JC845]|uniref:DUF6807 domain-containing protein n=1 Tax=Maioricimonas sp. JC845 TaxID=3232138 RepID=UPI003459516A